jgi:hypothetical protein
VAVGPIFRSVRNKLTRHPSRTSRTRPGCVVILLLLHFPLRRQLPALPTPPPAQAAHSPPLPFRSHGVRARCSLPAWPAQCPAPDHVPALDPASPTPPGVALGTRTGELEEARGAHFGGGGGFGRRRRVRGERDGAAPPGPGESFGQPRFGISSRRGLAPGSLSQWR